MGWVNIYLYCAVSLVPTSLTAKKTTEEAVLILLISGVDTANKVCCAYIKHQSDLYAPCALYPVYKRLVEALKYGLWDISLLNDPP